MARRASRRENNYLDDSGGRWMVLWITEGGASPLVTDGAVETIAFDRESESAEQIAALRNERLRSGSE